MPDNPQDFSEKVLAKLKELNRAVDLTEETVQPQAVVESVVQEMSTTSDASQMMDDEALKSAVLKILNDNAVSYNFEAFGTPGGPGGGGTIPVSGGNKDILIIPGFGGTSAETTSQINFYWSEPATIPSAQNGDTGARASIIPYFYGTTNTKTSLFLGGYYNSAYYGPSTTYGGVTGGQLAQIAFHPFDGQIDTNTVYFSGGVGVTTAAGILAWSSSVGRLFVGNASAAKQIAYTDDVTAANQLSPSTEGLDTNMYPVMVKEFGTSVSQFVYTGSSSNTLVFNATNGDLTVTGDIAVNGGDLTSSAATFNLLASPTTINFGAAAIALDMAVNTSAKTLNIGTGGAAAANINIGTSVFGGTITLNAANIVSNVSTTVAFLNTNINTVNAFGSASTINEAGSATAVNYNVGTQGKTVNIATGGAAAANIAIGTSVFGGTITLDAANIITNVATTVAFLNTTLQTINTFGNAGTVNFNVGTQAKTVNIATGGTAATNIAIGTSVFSGTITLDGAVIKTNISTTVSLFNTNVNFINAFGAATTISIGNTAGTATIANNTVSLSGTVLSGTALTTISLGTGAGAKTINIGIDGGANAANISLGTSLGSGTITLNASTIKSDVGTTLTFINTTVDKLNAFNSVTSAFLLGTAGTITMGNSSGIATTNNVTISFPNATAILGKSAGTLDLLQDPSTIRAFGGASSLTIAGTTVTTSINIGTGASATAAVKTINIGTGATAGGTTFITIGSASGTNTISFNSQRLQNVADPQNPQDAATKYYVDAYQQGLDLHESVRAVSYSQIATSVFYYQSLPGYSTSGWYTGSSYIESTFNEALNSTYFDGVTLAVGDRVLVAAGANTSTYNVGGNTATPAGTSYVINGIYTVGSLGSSLSKWRIYRATDSDDNIELEGGTFAFVQEGTIYDNSAWVITNNTATEAITFGTSAINWTQFSGAGQITFNAPLSKSGNQVSLSLKTGGGLAVESSQLAVDLSAGSITGTLGLGDGGTNNASLTATSGGVIYGDGSKLVANSAGLSNQVLLSGGSGAPTWAAISLAGSSSSIAGTLTVVNGGTGLATTLANSILVGNGTGALTQASTTVAGRVITYNGSTTDWGWVNLGSTGAVTSVLGLGNGGTNANLSATNGGIVYSTATAFAVSVAGTTTGQVLLSNGAAAPNWGQITLSSAAQVTGTLAFGNGGTGASSFTGGTVVVANSTATALVSVPAAGSTNRWLYSTGTGTSNQPAWSAVTLPNTYATYDIVFATSATALSSIVNSTTSVLVSNAAGPIWLQGLTANRILKTSGSAVSWSQVDLTTDVTGVLPTANGGTNNATNPTSGGVAYGSSTAQIAYTPAGTTGNVLISAGAGTPTFSAITLSNSNSVTGILGTGNGGTGQSVFSSGGVVFATSATVLSSNVSALGINQNTTGSNLYLNAPSTTGTSFDVVSSITSGTVFKMTAGSITTGGKFIDAVSTTSKFSVDFNGNLRATTKSFDIEHPTKPGKRLVYGVLEGPEHGVYHRGTAEGKGLIKVNLPEYWYLLVGADYTLQLTPWGKYSVHIVEKTENYFSFKLSSDPISQKFKTIKVDYIVHGSRLDAPLEIEQE
jgi:hypothetical protein